MLYTMRDFKNNGGKNSCGIRLVDMSPGKCVIVDIVCPNNTRVELSGVITRAPFPDIADLVYSQIKVEKQNTELENWHFPKGEIIAVYPDCIKKIIKQEEPYENHL
ncbi:MAG: hypothetical protein J6S14_15645 [Clostridia bacterium]|nr:hypothetical protein [Clostridia bacterium]